MSLTLRQVFNLVQRSNPELLDKPLYTADCDEAYDVTSVEYWWKDADGHVMNDEWKEDAICEADYPLHYANQLTKVAVLS